MTTQALEMVHIDGKAVEMESFPLTDYFNLSGISLPLARLNTAYFRRYKATWEVSDDRLYLINLEGRLENGSALCIATLFPYYKDRVFAFWYTDTLHVLQGRRFMSDMGFPHESDALLNIEIEGGIVIKKTIEDRSDAEGLKRYQKRISSPD